MQHPEIDLDKRLAVVCLGAKFGLRRALESGDNLCASKGVAKLKLAIRVERERVDSQAAEFVARSQTFLTGFGLSKSDRDFKSMIVIVAAFSQGIETDHLDFIA